MSEHDAVNADEEGDLIRAAALYEECLPGGLTLGALLNLAVLYWQATDFGFLSAKNLPKEFVKRAGGRIAEVLQVASERFPGAEEVEFWKRYIAWADLGEPFSPDECQALTERRPDYGEPMMYLLPATHTAEYRGKAQAALSAYRGQRTVRASYVTSVLESALQQAG